MRRFHHYFVRRAYRVGGVAGAFKRDGSKGGMLYAALFLWLGVSTWPRAVPGHRQKVLGGAT